MNTNKVFITGDIHQSIDIGKLSAKNWKEGKELNKSDILIILGDIGLVWNGDKEEQYWQEWLDDKPWTTFCIIGNHDSYDLIPTYPLVDCFGGHARQIQPSIFYAETGELFGLNGIRAFVVNGAKSVDKNLRTPHKTWWEEELPNKELCDKIMTNFLQRSEEIDCYLSHQAPNSYILNRLNYGIDACDAVSDMLNTFQRIHPAPNFFGHHHRDSMRLQDNCMCIYNHIFDLKKILEKGI